MGLVAIAEVRSGKVVHNLVTIPSALNEKEQPDLLRTRQPGISCDYGLRRSDVFYVRHKAKSRRQSIFGVGT